MTTQLHNSDVPWWFGVKFPDLDCPDWLPYMEAEALGEEPDRKLTIPVSKVVFNVARTDGSDFYDLYGNTLWPDYLWESAGEEG